MVVAYPAGWIVVGVPEEVAAQAEARIRSQVGGRVSGLRVVIQGNGLVLQGRSRTQHARQIALHVAMESTSLPVVNEIQV
jgi:uncharacterized protein YfaP (DUF2135 family)